jgi:16S rRNA (cytidine1402-2'-O)-methyltransferase
MLSIIGTPIGNLEDLSIRAARTLLEADVILAEDTRTVQTLLQRAKAIMTNNKEWILRQAQDDKSRSDSGRSQNDKPTQRDPDLHRDDKVNDIHSQKVVSYYKEVEFEKLPDIIGWLEAGLHVTLVSEAGMPVISDPGHLLVQTAQKHRIPLTVIPGPSSVHTALVASGVKFDHYQFVGFLPKKDKERLKLFEKLQMMQENLGKIKLVFVAFESPERVQDTLTLLYEAYPDMKIVLCRELTKKFEEIVFQPSADTAYRGEIVLILDFVK